MKKMAIAAATTTTIAALASMLVAPAAQADPYPRSIDTQCSATADDTRVAPGDEVSVKFKWTADGNVAPRGSVKFVVKRSNGVVVTRGSFFKPAGQNSKTIDLVFENRGNFTVKFDTNTGPNSVFQNCSATSGTIKVRNRF